MGAMASCGACINSGYFTLLEQPITLALWQMDVWLNLKTQINNSSHGEQ